MCKKFEIICDKNSINKVLKFLPKKGIIILKGNLASGKTTLTKQIVKAIEPDFANMVSSPTFSIMNRYGSIFHYDLYQNDLKKIQNNGLFDNLFEDGLHIVEWGEELIPLLKKLEIGFCLVEISTINNDRKYEITCIN